jgi:hypothetical protein
MGHKTQADFVLPETRDRLLHALRELFKAAADVQGERIAAGVPALAATPVLLFDEDERLARAGGEAVFKILALLLIVTSCLHGCTAFCLVVVVATPVGPCNHHCTGAIIIASISLLVVMQASASPELLG